MFPRRLFSLRTACALLAAACALPALAAAGDDYPSRPVKIVVPWPAGGPNDVIARILAQRLSGPLGQPVVVENRAGGNALVGSNAVALSAPDGYTLLLANSTPLVINLTPGNPDGIVDLQKIEPVGLVAEFPYVFVVRSALPVTDLRSLIAYARANDGKLKIAVAGVGGFQHFMTEELIQSQKLNVKLIPYQGTAPAVKDLLGGHTDGHFEATGSVAPYVKSGALKALATAATSRSTLLPDVATTVEQGFATLTSTSWFALVAPAGLPPAVREKLARETQKITRSEDYRAALLAVGIQARSSSAKEAAGFIGQERDKWARVVAESHFQLK